MQLTSPARSPAPPCDGTALRYSSGLPFPACLRSLFITSLSKPVIYQGKIGYPERYESAQGQEDRKYPFSSPDPANRLDDKAVSFVSRHHRTMRRQLQRGNISPGLHNSPAGVSATDLTGNGAGGLGDALFPV